MRKIAILGANGQVGAELCVLLSRTRGIELVPVCRNPTGSAFLRYSGIACRHGRPADPKKAAHLYGDCDVIVNCALGAGTPGEIRAFDRDLLRNIFYCSRWDATIIHCSTLMVHGDPRPGKLRRRDSYGSAKFAAEKRVHAESKRTGKAAYILRLGHVCGQLQNITQKIRNEIASGQVVLPPEDVPSNTVYTVTIVDAILSIVAGNEAPGTFDLTNVPQWTWRQVYEYESEQCKQRFVPQFVAPTKPQGSAEALLTWARGRMSRFARTGFVRRTLEKWLARAPAALNDRAQATWAKLRARAEINAISTDPAPAPELSWIRLDYRSLTSLQPTERLLASEMHENLTDDIRSRWPKDLKFAAEAPRGALQQAS